MRCSSSRSIHTLVAMFPVAVVSAGAIKAAAQTNDPPTNSCPHNIDPAKCPFCDPSRIERLGMCNEHAVPEALCTKCKPYLKTAFQAAEDWCQEHDTPQSQCHQCNPQAVKALTTRASGAGVTHRWQREPSSNCTTSKNLVRLATLDVAEAAGFAFTQVSDGPLDRAIERNVQLAYNANRYVRLSSRVPGVITDVLKDLGETVRKGDALAMVDSSELGAAKAALLQAIETERLWQTNAARERALVEKGIGVEREALEAETKAVEAHIQVDQARQRLQNLGLSADQVRAVQENNDTSSLLELRASLDGIVVERNAVLGELTDSGKPLLAVADTSVMWAMVDLLESDLASVKVGQKASVRLDGLPGKSFPGAITWISTRINEKTRTAPARIELTNPGGHLRANMFGKAAISTGDNRRAVTVPKDAVQWEGCCNVAFVKVDDKGLVYQPARLTLGFDAGDRYEVVDGLQPGQTIVTNGSFILKNEILKDSIGAGCCEVEHLKK